METQHHNLPKQPGVAIMRKSSSGVGMRSSLSMRSEDEDFSDAATDFIDGSGYGDVSEGVMQRFYSMQNDFDDTNIASENSIDSENAIADNTSEPNSLLKDQIQTVLNSNSENDTVEALIASQDHTCSSVIGPVEEDITQLSKTSHELDSVSCESKEIVSSEQKPELITSYDNNPSEAFKDEDQGHILIAKSTGIESVILENDTESCQCHVEDSLGDFSSIEHSVEVVDATNGSTSKLSDVMENHGLNTETHDDAIPLPTQSDMVVADPEVSDRCSEDNDIESVDVMEGKINVGQSSIADINTVRESGQTPDTEDSEADNIKLESEVVEEFMSESLENEKVSSSFEEQKPVFPLEKSVENDECEVTSKELPGNSLLADSVTDEIPAAVDYVVSNDDSKDMDAHRKTEVVDAQMEGNKRSEDDHGESQDSKDEDGQESKGEDGEEGVMKSDNLAISNSNMIPGRALNVFEDAQRLLQSSAGVESDRINHIKRHVAISAVDDPDSSSQADSLEANWGSISVMSALSDTPPAADTPASPVEQNTSLEPKSVPESQHSDIQTSSDTNLGVKKMEDISEIQTLEEQQPNTIHVENASLGGKRDEEIIEKVTNWSTDKNHTPLKTLLGEATARSRAESPLHYNQSSTSMPQTNEIPVSNNGFSKTEKVIHSSNDPSMEAEVENEWDSPARYPVNIKTEKKRGNTKPSWMIYFCCSSVNAR